jgi:hypothetical protein
VAEADGEAGHVLNTVVVTAKDEDGEDVEDEDEIDIPVGALKVIKTADKDTAKVGDTIVYTLYVKNVGKATLTDVKLTDELLGIVDLNIGNLIIGETWIRGYTYIVTEADGEAGHVLNTVIVTAKDEDGEDVEDEDEIDIPVSPIEKPTPTASPTPTPTVSPTPSPTPTPTASPTPTPTASPTPTPTASPTASPTPTPTATPTASPTPTPTASPTPRPTNIVPNTVPPNPTPESTPIVTPPVDTTPRPLPQLPPAYRPPIEVMIDDDRVPLAGAGLSLNLGYCFD